MQGWHTHTLLRTSSSKGRLLTQVIEAFIFASRTSRDGGLTTICVYESYAYRFSSKFLLLLLCIRFLLITGKGANANSICMPNLNVKGKMLLRFMSQIPSNTRTGSKTASEIIVDAYRYYLLARPRSILMEFRRIDMTLRSMWLKVNATISMNTTYQGIA